MRCNLLLDGNYILNKNVFALHKNNVLFGNLYKSLEHTVKQYRTWFPFTNVWFVSDSRAKSWRKKNYRGMQVFEADHIEGDDFISYLINESNKAGISTITVSNDHDIKQLLNWQTDPLIMNIMANEMYNKEKIFLPKNYQI